jgi:hypothetical protein
MTHGARNEVSTDVLPRDEPLLEGVPERGMYLGVDGIEASTGRHRVGQAARSIKAAGDHDRRPSAPGDEAEERARARVCAVTNEAGIRPVPFRRRVQIQLGALLAEMADVRGRRPSGGSTFRSST